jgi:hypothetical protein
MTNKFNMRKLLPFGLAVAGFMIGVVGASEANAQTRDPFQKPGYKIQKNTSPGVYLPGGKSGPVNPLVPTIEQRIEFFKRLREQAALSGTALPKVTSVLTLDEMAVTGIFRTPRGYAAMVEATPIKLSYTIYPGEKFFDGQLVAVEENRLVFRKVTKNDKGKFIASVENKPLRQYSMQSQVDGTAPAEGPARTSEVIASAAAEPNRKDAVKAPVTILSPVDEMNKQGETEKTDKTVKTAGKPVKVARNKK